MIHKSAAATMLLLTTLLAPFSLLGDPPATTPATAPTTAPSSPTSPTTSLIAVPTSTSLITIPDPKSLLARNAIAKCDQTIADADKAYKKAVTEAKLKLNIDLRKAQQNAMTTGDQDEVLAIAAKIKRTEDERLSLIGSAPPSDDPATIHILAAFYGQNISWLDVTDKVQEAIARRTKWSTTVATPNWGDPVPGWRGPRTLLVRYTANGKMMIKFAYEDKQLSLP